ncbi:translocase [Alicycliphilus denitrificans]|uniref:lipopolysaccharide biosynthesis protein n=1 Tax=Alicycliphilus denitrificans TaxID=179636 RepID=UPI00095A53C4|nr:oligosaccharide flippase family protein [Alicycliphilus denitrificans]MBN9573378.1 oligosaccharide flippase family protein [Alicycliphilus denitrificans]OJW86936.1 MAG: polysaccharide biosynthesis protein [Alicycliphilus sp. 69-12]BCN40100.1 translocase [Alicycliphilus denitrificans]
MTPGLLRATLTLLAGSVLAHALPLLLGPALTRLYAPADFGQYALLWALATNLAVVACARYEFALPLEKSPRRAALLMALCARLLLAVTAASTLLALALLWGRGQALAWLLPAGVLAIGATQWLTLWATRTQRFGLLSAARLVQQGGGALLQVLLGLLKTGPAGLLLGPIAAGLGAAWLLARPAPRGGWRRMWRQPLPRLKAMAARHRDFPLYNTPHAFIGALQDTLTLLLIAAWAGDAAAGLWALALRYLKAPATLLGGALSQALYPQLVHARSADHARALVRRSMLALALLAAPLAAVLLLWGPGLFAWAFGAQWEGAGALARGLALYIGLHFVASPLSVVTLAWRAQPWALRLSMAGQAAFFAGLCAGLAWDGLQGAAWGVSAAMAAYFLYYFKALAFWSDIPHESPA